MTSIRAAAFVATLAALLTISACSQVDAPAPGAQGSAPAGSTAAAPPAASTAPEPASVAELLPAGPGREPLLNNCSSCHNLACSLIGQRTAARWDSLKESHKEKVPDADLEAVFAYLKMRFNDANPEPKVPAKFLQGGCTPF